MGRASVTRARGRALGTALALAAGCLAAAGVPVASAHVPPRCDNLDPTVCLQPFPNDYFTKTDSRTDPGRRVHFDLLAMPRNAAGKPIDPTEWNRNDGFSPGALITLHIAGLDNQMALD